MLFFVAVVCMLLAATHAISGLLGLFLWIAAVIVAMHVFATRLGHNLQARTDAEQLPNANNRMENPANTLADAQLADLAAIRSAARSPWHGRGGTYLPWLSRVIAGAVMFGGFAGVLLLNGAGGSRTSPAGIVVGASSFAVLCGWFSFLGGNFYGVFRHGFREAIAEQQNDQARPVI